MKWMVIALPLTILMDCIAFVNFFSWQQQAVYEFQQRQLDLQVNYAVDAATQDMLEDGTHIDTDYINTEFMKVEPEIALNTYEAVLLRNLGWGDSEKNREDLEQSYMPFFIVAGYDGYYLYGKQRVLQDVNSVTMDSYDYKWTPKLPYSVTDTTGYVYFYYLGADTYGKCSLTSTGSDGLPIVEYDLPLKSGTGYGSSDNAKVTISETLMNACNSALYIGLEGNTDVQYYIPSEMTEFTSSNPVTSPSVLTYMSVSDGTVLYDTVTFGIGGAKIDKAEYVICYKNNNGVKKYTWAENRTEIEKDYTILEVLSSPETAAMHGYSYDYDFEINGRI
jgi:hypothetical protein